MRIDPNQKLLDLDPGVYTRLEDSLQKDDSWKKLAELLKEFRHLSGRKLLDLSRCENPATRLLEELKSKLYEVRHLQVLLQRCQLYEALSVIADPEPLEIIRQPTSFLPGGEILKAKIGNPLSLEFHVKSIPPPKYSWLLNGFPIPGKYSSRLSYDSYNPTLEGLYTCVATQHILDKKVGEVYSDVVLVETLAEAPIVTQKPDSHISLCEGSPILLKVKASAYPIPTYEWTHENEVLTTETNNFLYRAKSAKEDGGVYKCYVTNKAGTEIVETNVVIYTENTTSLYCGVVTEKIALLIANDNYENEERLWTPKNDVAELARIFQNLGFKTLCFLNMNLYEMKVLINIFAGMVAEGAYAVFYFAGHGFSAGDAFLLPVDCPDHDSYMQKDAVRESEILGLVMEKQPALFIVLLDMCLKQPKRNIGKSELEHFETNRNLIRAYSTTSHKSAYEKRDESNSIYVSALRKYLGEKMPILAILNKVNAEIAQLCPQQMPTVSFITAEDFLLDQEINAPQPESKMYKCLNTETVTYDDRFLLRKFRGVYNNIFELHIFNSSLLHYESNAKTIEHHKNHKNHLLVISNVQKLENDFTITLTTNRNETKTITLPTSKLGTFFKNI